MRKTCAKCVRSYACANTHSDVFLVPRIRILYARIFTCATFNRVCAAPRARSSSLCLITASTDDDGPQRPHTRASALDDFTNSPFQRGARASSASLLCLLYYTIVHICVNFLLAPCTQFAHFSYLSIHYSLRCMCRALGCAVATLRCRARLAHTRK